MRKQSIVNSINRNDIYINGIITHCNHKNDSVMPYHYGTRHGLKIKG